MPNQKESARESANSAPASELTENNTIITEDPPVVKPNRRSWIIQLNAAQWAAATERFRPRKPAPNLAAGAVTVSAQE